MASTSMEGRDYCSMPEFDALQRIGVTEIDGGLLMELLEDSYDDDVAEDDDRLGYVIRSLEEEIGDRAAADVMDVGDGESTTGPIDEGGDCGLMEDLLSDLDSDDGSRAAFVVEDPFDWVDMDMAPPCSGAGWYSDVVEVRGDDEVVGLGEAKDYLAMYYGQLNVEQVYSPLWQ